MIYVCIVAMMEVKAVYMMYSMDCNYDGSVAMMRMRCVPNGVCIVTVMGNGSLPDV
jgi:hypothetical protein